MAESGLQVASPAPPLAGAEPRVDRWPHGIVARYFDLWRRHLTGQLGTVFSPHASYWEKPQLPAMSGLAEIAAYWRREVETQNHTQVSFEIVGHDEERVDVQWSATFARHGQRYLVQGTMRLYRDATDPDRVQRLEERFETQKVPATAGCLAPRSHG